MFVLVFVTVIELLVVIPQEFDQFRVAVRPLEILRLVQRTDALHFLLSKHKVEYVQVLLFAPPFPLRHWLSKLWW